MNLTGSLQPHPSVRPSGLAPRPVAHRPPPCHGRSRCDPGTSPPVPTLPDTAPGLGCVLSAIPRERRVGPPPLPSRPSGPPRRWGAAHPDQARQTTGRRPSFCRNRHLTWGQRAPCRGAPTDLRVTRRALASCATNCAAWHRRTEFPSLRLLGWARRRDFRCGPNTPCFAPGRPL